MAKIVELVAVTDIGVGTGDFWWRKDAFRRM